MGNRVWTSTTAIFLGLSSLCASAATPKYDNLIVFGDSYCDVGDIFAATGGAEARAPYFNGRFSNGPIWLDHVAEFWGNGYASSVGQLAHSFAAKITGRLKEAKLF